VLNGNKIWISNGGFAEVFTVFAQVPSSSVNEDRLQTSVTKLQRDVIAQTRCAEPRARLKDWRDSNYSIGDNA